MTSTKARLIMVVGAFVVMGGAYAFKGWQLDKDADQACATMLQGYRQVVADQGEGAVDSLKFAIQARQYASHDDDGACAELRSLARTIEADHDAKAKAAPQRRLPAPTRASPGPAAQLTPAPEGEIKTR
jgi:type II secretory pathway component PulL